MKKKILFGMLLSILCLYMSCTKEGDSPTPTPEQKQVEISGFSPTSGWSGSEVVITGANFNGTTTGNVVTIGNSSATVKSATATQIIITIPEGAESDKINISVNGNVATSSTILEVLEDPGIVYFYPFEGQVGSEVVLEVSNFREIVDQNMVYFGDTKVDDIQIIYGTKLVVKVPEGANSGKIRVSLSNGEGATSKVVESVDGFTVLDFENDPTSGSWKRVADIPLIYFRPPFATSSGNMAYTGFGPTSYSWSNLNSEVYQYNPLNNSWILKNEFSQGPKRREASSFEIDGILYVALGIDADENRLTDLWAYDPNGGSWTKKADFPGVGRDRATAFTINGKGYVGFGEDPSDSNVMTDLYEYDPTNNSWNKKADLEVGRGRNPCFVINGIAYVGLGSSLDNFLANDLWAFDPVDNSWSKKADLPFNGLHTQTGFTLGSYGFLGIGWNGNNAIRSKEFWRYDPVGDSWKRVKDYPGSAREYTAGFGLNGKGYVVGGEASIDTWTNEVWEFDPGN